MSEPKTIPITPGITPQAIRSQLRRILASESFLRSRRIQRFLAYVVEETLAGRAVQLKEYAIGVAVFDKGPDFEPAIDPIVRNEARRLRLKLGEYYASPQPADGVRIEIPKGAYVPVFSVRPLRQSIAPDRATRVAVLPFGVLSSSPEAAVYGQALCMSLTANLTNVDGLEAVAHGYLREQPLREAAEELSLSHVVQGSILESRERLRVVVNFIRTADGRQLWADQYDFEGGDMLAFQSAISDCVLHQVTGQLGLGRPLPTRFVQAA